MLNRARFPKLKAARALIFALMTCLPAVATAAPLHDASAKGNVLLVKRSLPSRAPAAVKAAMNWEDERGRTLLHKASFSSSFEVVKILKAAGGKK